MEPWEAEYVYIHIRVAHLLFRSSRCNHMVQVAFRAEVMPIAVEVHPDLCTSSVSVDSLLCHVGKEGSCSCEFHEPLLGVFLSQSSTCYARETQYPASSLLRLWREVS